MLSYKKTIEELKERLLNEFGDRINAIILYGSAARGEYKEEKSDIDIMIIAKDDSLYKQIRRIATKLDSINSTMTSLVCISSSKFELNLKLGSNFLLNTMEEGEILYDDGIFERARKSLLKKSG